MPSVAIDTGWTFAPIVLIALAGYLGVYVARWRTARREGGARAASGWRLARVVRWRARPVRRADLARRPARRAARLDAHGPAPADRRHRRDPAHARADPLDPAPRDPPHPPDRARRRAVRVAVVRRGRLRRRDVALARPDDLRRRAASTRASTRSSTSRSPPRASSTGGTCCRRSARGCGWAGWRRSPTWRARSCSSASSASLLAFAPELIYDAYDTRGLRWGMTRSTTSTSRA